jgi:hypothetical protein
MPTHRPEILVKVAASLVLERADAAINALGRYAAHITVRKFSWSPDAD